MHAFTCAANMEYQLHAVLTIRAKTDRRCDADSITRRSAWAQTTCRQFFRNLNFSNWVGRMK